MSNSAQDLLKPLTASKLPVVYAKGSLRFKQIKCDSALAAFLVDLEGGGGADFVFFDENSTALNATMTIDDESTNAVLPVGPLRGFRDYPCKRIYLTCTAQSGKVLNLWYGKGTFLYGAQPAGKGQWYDRNPTPRVLTYEVDASAPSAVTVRSSYTVPVGKKAMFEFASAFARRNAAAAPVGMWNVAVQYTDAASNVGSLINLQTKKNAVDDFLQGSGGFNAVAVAGDSLRIVSGDLSTGGTVDFRLAAKYTEYDA